MSIPFEAAGAVWGDRGLFQNAPGDPAAGYSEGLINSYPAILMGSGLSCADAKEQMRQLFELGVCVIKDNTTCPAPTGVGMVGCSGEGAGCVGGSGSFLGSDLGLWSLSVDGWRCDWGSQFMPAGAVGEYGMAQGVACGSCKFQPTITVTGLMAFNFEIWWCLASGCCAPPAGGPPPKFLIPPPPMEDREPVQGGSSVPIIKAPLYFSNYSWQVVKSMGQVK